MKVVVCVYSCRSIVHVGREHTVAGTGSWLYVYTQKEVSAQEVGLVLDLPEF